MAAGQVSDSGGMHWVGCCKDDHQRFEHGAQETLPRAGLHIPEPLHLGLPPCHDSKLKAFASVFLVLCACRW